MHLFLSDMQYDKERKRLFGKLPESMDNFPKDLVVFSSRTGRGIKFVQVSAEIQMENEFWDGEMMEYEPSEPLETVRFLTLTY